MSYEKKSYGKWNGRLLLCAFLFAAVCLSSCTAVIDPAAGWSGAGIIAVIGEYAFAIFIVIVVAALWLLRSLGLATILCAILAFLDLWELIISPKMMLILGIVIFLISFIPVKPYKPTVLITNNHEIVNRMLNIPSSNRPFWQELLLSLIAGIILLFIEYAFFVKS